MFKHVPPLRPKHATPHTTINGAEISESECASAKSRRRRYGSALKYNIAHFSSCGAYPHNRSRNT